MSNQFNREHRYLVFKKSDAKAALSSHDIATLNRLSEKVDNWRHGQAKMRLTAVVVEHDWPEYEPTWKAIEARTALTNAGSQ